MLTPFWPRVYQFLPLPATHTSTEYSASSAKGPTFYAFSPTHGIVTCDPKLIWDIWRDA